MFRARTFLAILTLAGLAIGFPATPAAADGNYYHCVTPSGTVLHVRWTPTSVTFGIPPTWGSGYKNATRNAASDITSRTQFNWIEDTMGGQTVTWSNLNNPDVNIAGATALAWDDTNCRMTYVALYLNFPHFQAFGDSTGQKQCTAIHEFGHGLGLDHASGNTIMNPDHWVRCHQHLWKTLFSVDRDDINALY